MVRFAAAIFSCLFTFSAISTNANEDSKISEAELLEEVNKAIRNMSEEIKDPVQLSGRVGGMMCSLPEFAFNKLKEVYPTAINDFTKDSHSVGVMIFFSASELSELAYKRLTESNPRAINDMFDAAIKDITEKETDPLKLNLALGRAIFFMGNKLADADLLSFKEKYPNALNDFLWNLPRQLSLASIHRYLKLGFVLAAVSRDASNLNPRNRMPILHYLMDRLGEFDEKQLEDTVELALKAGHNPDYIYYDFALELVSKNRLSALDYWTKGIVNDMIKKKMHVNDYCLDMTKPKSEVNRLLSLFKKYSRDPINTTDVIYPN